MLFPFNNRPGGENVSVLNHLSPLHRKLLFILLLLLTSLFSVAFLLLWDQSLRVQSENLSQTSVKNTTRADANANRVSLGLPHFHPHVPPDVLNPPRIAMQQAEQLFNQINNPVSVSDTHSCTSAYNTYICT